MEDALELDPETAGAIPAAPEVELVEPEGELIAAEANQGAPEAVSCGSEADLGASEAELGESEADLGASDSESAEPAKKSRAGRNLPAAVGVGVGLLALLGLTLAFRPEPFVVFVAVAISAGIWELRSAFEHANLQLAIWPLLAGTTAMVVAAFLGGASALLTTYILTAMAIVAWFLVLAALERAPVSRLNIMASILGASYLPLMAGFVILLLRQQPYGNWRVAMLILLCVANDTGGYFAGIFFGKHPMAPSVSPKKSWEGFCGSVALTTLVGILGSHWVLSLPFAPNLSLTNIPDSPGAFWLSLFGSAIGLGILLGIFTAITSTLGDLSESLIKRDLGIKDMGSILPGHGGVLDRIDSIIFSAPFVFLILSIASQFVYPAIS